MKVNFEDTKRLIAQCVENVVNEVWDDTTSDELESLVDNEVERVAYGDVCCGLQILASYGWSDALAGNVANEDSPIRLFGNDVYDRVVGLLEREGIKLAD